MCVSTKDVYNFRPIEELDENNNYGFHLSYWYNNDVNLALPVVAIPRDHDNIITDYHDVNQRIEDFYEEFLENFYGDIDLIDNDDILPKTP